MSIRVCVVVLAFLLGLGCSEVETGVSPTPASHPSVILTSKWLDANWGSMASSLVAEGMRRGMALDDRASEKVRPSIAVYYEDPNWIEVEEGRRYEVPLDLSFSAVLASGMTFSGEMSFTLTADVKAGTVESDADFSTAELRLEDE